VIKISFNRLLPAAFVVATSIFAQSVLTQPAVAQAPGVPPEREALVREYLEVTNSDALAAQMLESMLPVFRDAYPSVPDTFFARLMGEVSSGNLSDFLIPVFAKNLTDQEMKAAIAYYRSPAGASMLRKMPVLMQEAQAAGATWGEQLGERIIRELEAEGYSSSGTTL
jgi:uncharacterized protein